MFNTGDVVVFDETSFNTAWVDKAKETGSWDHYKKFEGKLFVFICEVTQAPGHCVLLELGTNSLEAMYHTSNFRLATEEEF